jgi:hypothetical protein
MSYNANKPTFVVRNIASTNHSTCSLCKSFVKRVNLVRAVEQISYNSVTEMTVTTYLSWHVLLSTVDASVIVDKVQLYKHYNLYCHIHTDWYKVVVQHLKEDCAYTYKQYIQYRVENTLQSIRARIDSATRAISCITVHTLCNAATLYGYILATESHF